MCLDECRHHHFCHPADHPLYRLDKSVHVRLGALVSAQYTYDDVWYRARIIAIYQSKGLLL